MSLMRTLMVPYKFDVLFAGDDTQIPILYISLLLRWNGMTERQ